MNASSPSIPRILAAALFLTAALAPPAHASFHLNEFSRIMTGYNGDATIQAVELRMLAGGENLVATGSIKTYDAAGNPLATLGTFAVNVPNGVLDRRILCATANFQSTFGIAADLTIAPGLPVGTGQVSFEEAGCFVNGIAYGAVTVPKNGVTSAAALPKDLAYVLVRSVDDATLPSCPLAEDAAARMTLQSGNASSPVVFRNNAGASVSVSSAVTAVGTLPRESALGVAPNPVRSGARVTAPAGGRLTIHDARGRLVRVLSAGASAGSPYAGWWSGQDGRGAAVPSGVYFLRLEGPDGIVARRFVVAR
jgi:hypothetical protein